MSVMDHGDGRHSEIEAQAADEAIIYGPGYFAQGFADRIGLFI